MRLKLRLNRPAGGESDIVVTADASVPVGEIARSLIELDPSVAPAGLAEATVAVRFPGQSRARSVSARTPVAESVLASGSDIQIVSAAETDADRGPVRAIVRVLDGPDRGREFPLRAGSRIIGRDESADIVLADPLVSKRHARVEVGRTVELVDLNSANGIVIDGGQIGRLTVQPGQTVLLGDTLVRVDIFPLVADDEVTGRAGAIEFNRSPRVEPRYAGEEIEAPDVPRDEDPPQFPWLILLSPLLIGALLFFALDRGISALAFVLAAPIMMIGSYFTQVMRERSRRKRAIELFEKKLERFQAHLQQEFERERAVRLAEAPSTAEVLHDAETLGPLLWTRRPEHWNFLNVRLGVGTAPTRTDIMGGRDSNGIAEYAERLDRVIGEFQEIPGVPLVDSLMDAGALGVAGGITTTTRACNGLLVQLTGMHSPFELSVAAIVGPAWGHEFEWLKWLPHTGAPNAPLRGVQLASTAASGAALLAALEDLIAERTVRRNGLLEQDRGAMAVDDSAMQRGAEVDAGQADPDDRIPTPNVLLLISDDAPVDRARLVSLVERAVAAGILPIWIAEDVASLPAVCRSFLEVDHVDPTRGAVGFVRTGRRTSDVAIEALEGETALRFARGLAAVSDSGALVADESDVPRSVSFLSLLGPEIATSSSAVIDRWMQNSSIQDRTPGAPHRARKAGRLRALVGQASGDALHLDLRTHGPHALVGGTTGSGKSEFLQAWVLGMAAEYSPDRVTFLFVDYKGGSAFADCVNLPHCVGLVTDLNTHLVRRALTSLRAELHHREHLLNRKKAKDLIELEKRGDPECPPALVLVIDEFAALVGEVPEFVDGVVDIAQRGRSLGIHLIMATQRPAGVIKDNLRANTNLRVALRMADEADSNDVVGTPLAGGFDPSVPGRGIAKLGPGRLVTFQTGYAGGWTSEEEEDVAAVDVADLVFGLERPWELPPTENPEPEADLGPNDTARLVASIAAAAASSEIPPPRKPWLDELAEVYDLSRLRQRSDEELLLGVTDDPTTQSQYPVYFRPDQDGNLAVYGTGGSGKSTVLRTIGSAAAITPRGGPVHVYGLDFGSGGLRALEPLPHVGSIISGDDTERTTRLLKMLRATVDERVERYTAVRAGTITEYRRLAQEPEEPRILLLLDGIAAFRQEYEFIGAPAATMLQQLLTDGRQVGIHVVVSADRAGSISPTLAASPQRRVVLRLADDIDYGGLDVPTDVLSPASAPGRAIIDQFETQIAVLGGTPSLVEQAAAIERLAETMTRRGVVPAPPIERLAEEIPYSVVAQAHPGAIPLGVSDEELQPVAVEPRGVFMLTGPPGSGRTTTVRTLVAGMDGSGAFSGRYYFGGRRSEVGRMPGWTGVATVPEDASVLAKELLPLASEPARDGARLAIVIETVPDFLSGPADADLQALVKAAKRNDHFVVGEAETSGWSQSWPLIVEFKSARRGLALQPDVTEGDILFKTGFPRFKRNEFPPGRGMLVQGGKARRVQVALPPG